MWHRSQTLAIGDVGQARVVADARGDAGAVWNIHDVVVGAVRPAGHKAWRPVAGFVGTEGEPESERPRALRAAMDAHGNAVVVWERSGVEQLIEAASMSAKTGRWSDRARLSAVRGETTGALDVAVDGRGDAVAVWEGALGHRGPQVVRAAVKPAGGRWLAPVVLSSTTGEGEHPQVAIDERGNTLAVWELHERIEGRSLEPNRGEVVQASSRPAGGEWQAPIDLSAIGRQDEHPHVVVDARGDAVVAWERVEVENLPLSVPTIAHAETTLVDAVTRPGPRGPWTPPVQLSRRAGQFASEPDVAIGAAGRAVVVWQQNHLHGNGIEAASWTGATWRPPVLLATWTHVAAPVQPGCGDGACSRLLVRPLPGAEPDVAYAGNEAVAVWRRASGYEGLIEATDVSAEGPKRSPSTRLSAAGMSEPQVALDGHARAFAA